MNTFQPEEIVAPSVSPTPVEIRKNHLLNLNIGKKVDSPGGYFDFKSAGKIMDSTFFKTNNLESRIYGSRSFS